MIQYITLKNNKTCVGWVKKTFLPTLPARSKKLEAKT